MDYGDIQEYLDEILGETEVHFTDLMQSLMSGDFSGLVQQVGELLRQGAVSGLNSNGKALRQVILTALFGALLSRFSEAFSKNGIGETGFYVTYLLLTSLLLGAFLSTKELGEELIRHMLQFMQVLIPVFFVAVAYAGGSVTALAFYQMVLLVIAAVQWLFLVILLPLIQVYVCLQLVNSAVAGGFSVESGGAVGDDSGMEYADASRCGHRHPYDPGAGASYGGFCEVSSFAPGCIRDPVGRKRRRSCRTGSPGFRSSD